ncbi:MAG: YbaN family protein [Firmicutes bacterium]|nr:YbaN family protein [Bacillota bacterium]
MKQLWVLFGFVSMALGVIGMILPILPTTPFFLLTAYLFTKGSKRFSGWFYRQKFVQRHLTNMTMTKQKKLILTIFVDGLLITYFIIFDHIVIRIILILLIVIKHIVFYRYVKISPKKIS